MLLYSFVFVIVFLIVSISIALLIIKTKSFFWSAISALLSPIQLHTFSVLSIYPSLSFLMGLFSVKSIFQIKNYNFFWLKSLIFLEVYRVVSISWSPNPILGIREIVYEMGFIFVLLSFSDKNISLKVKEKIITYTLGLASLNAIFVIIFRVYPPLEFTFLHSYYATFFISPNVLTGLFGLNVNNVLDPTKAGGFFVNANISAAYIGLSSMGSIYFGKAFKSRFLILNGIFLWVAVFFTGSKAASIVAIFLPIFVTYVNLFAVKGLTLKNLTIIFWFTIFVTFFGFVFKFLLEDSSFLNQTSSTLQTRFIIWEFAWSSFVKSPILGLGFGGWENGMASYAFLNGFRGVLPAHNAFLILWSQSGFIAALLGLIFLISFTSTIIKQMKFATGNRVFVLKGIFSGFLWVAIQAMGENFGLIGEPHISPLLAMLIGYAISINSFDMPSRTING